MARFDATIVLHLDEPDLRTAVLEAKGYVQQICDDSFTSDAATLEKVEVVPPEPTLTEQEQLIQDLRKKIQHLEACNRQLSY